MWALSLLFIVELETGERQELRYQVPERFTTQASCNAKGRALINGSDFARSHLPNVIIECRKPAKTRI